jgi:hypothetical protein
MTAYPVAGDICEADMTDIYLYIYIFINLSIVLSLSCFIYLIYLYLSIYLLIILGGTIGLTNANATYSSYMTNSNLGM